VIRKNIAFVHIPPHQLIDARFWRARRSMLRLLGWQGRLGLCPLPIGKEHSSSPLPLQESDAALGILRHLGCETARGIKELDIDRLSLLEKVAPSSQAGMTVQEWHTSIVNRQPNGRALIRAHVDALIIKILAKMDLVEQEEMLFIASPHRWLLLILIHQLVAVEHLADRASVSKLDIDHFPGIAVLNAQGAWCGFLDLSPRQSIDWYLDPSRK